MEYTIKKLPKSKIEIKITVSQEELSKAKIQACDEISKEVKIKGFRPGHIPAHIIEEHIDPKYIEAHTQEVALKKAYADSIIKEGIQVISRPEVKIDSHSPFVFTATVATMPEVEIGDYKSIKVAEPKIEVKDEDINAVLDDLKKYSTTYEKVDRKAKHGDRIEVDFDGFDENDQPVEGTSSKHHPIIIGDGNMIPGFEAELIDLKSEDEKEFKITFPKDYHKEDFQNKELKFKIKVHSVEESKSPELTDELIEKMTGKKQSLDDLKKDITLSLENRKKQEAKNQRENEYLEKLLDKATAEIPEELIEDEVNFMLEEIKEEVGAKNIDLATFLEQAKTTEEELRKKYEPEAEKRIRIRLALQHLIKAEDIKVTDEEFQEEVNKIKSKYPKKEHYKIEKDVASSQTKAQIINRLALRKLFDKVLG